MQSIRNCNKVNRLFLPSNSAIEIHATGKALYRFLEEPFASDFVRGSIQVKPLSSFRCSLCDQRRDQSEGVHSGPMSAEEAAITFLGGKATNPDIFDNGVSWIAPPSLVLCLSRFPYGPLASKFASGGKSASCIEIRDPEEFLKRLDRAVRSKMSGNGWPVDASVAGEVFYANVPNMESLTGPLPAPPAFIKPVRRGKNFYMEETEYRVAWQLARGRWREPDPMVLDAGDLSDIAGILEDAKLLPDGYSGLTAKVIERP